MAYAANTDVPLERSIGEIIGMLRKAGAERIAQFEEPEAFTVQFALAERIIKFRVPIPTATDMPTHDGRRSLLDDSKRLAMARQAARQRGRALRLVVQAKLESVESEVETFEQAFFANVVMADGKTLYERMAEPVALEYKTGKIAPLMLGSPT
jgi:hypothetical protein